MNRTDSTKTIARGVTVIALTALAITGSANNAGAAPKTVTTLRAGIYQTPTLVAVGAVLPAYVKVAKPGTYATTRTGTQICTLRAIGEIGETTSNLILARAKKGTVKVSAESWVVEITGPCTWNRKG
jgi:hypothetical protein